MQTNFLIFYTKQAITIAKIVLQRFLKVSSIKSLKYKLVYLLSNFQSGALKNLHLWYKFSTELPSSALVERVFFAGKDITLQYFTRGRLFDQRHFTWCHSLATSPINDVTNRSNPIAANKKYLEAKG